MVGYKDNLFVFGGEVGFSNGVETPLWMYNITVRQFISFFHQALSCQLLFRIDADIIFFKVGFFVRFL